MIPKYSMRIEWSDRDKEYFAFCPELGDISASGDSPEQAVTELREAIDLVVKEMRKDNTRLPGAVKTSRYSGQIRLRIPKTIHGQLASQAKAEGVSLNQLMVTYLTQGVTQTVDYNIMSQKLNAMLQRAQAQIPILNYPGFSKTVKTGRRIRTDVTKPFNPIGPS